MIDYIYGRVYKMFKKKERERENFEAREDTKELGRKFLLYI